MKVISVGNLYVCKLITSNLTTSMTIMYLVLKGRVW